MEIEKRVLDIINSLKVVDYHEDILDTNGRFVTIKDGHYHLNNGKTIDRESVVKNVGTGCASCVFAVTDEGKILVVIHPRIILPTDTKINVEVPAGYIEDGEDSRDAALRELREETGYSTDSIQMIDSYYPSVGVSGERIDLFLALNCKKVQDQHLDDDEFLVCEEVTLDEFQFLLDHSYIHGVNERMGYLYYLNYLKKGSL